MLSSKDLYDDNWQDWADMKIYGPASRWLRYLINKILQSADTASINTWLDVGCGEGTNTAHLADKIPGCHFMGIDFSSTAIEIAQQVNARGNIQFREDLESSALKEQFDTISCFEVLEHVEDWQGLLLKMVGASNRYLLLSFPTGRMRPFEVNVGHLRNFQPGEVEAFLSEHQFRPVSILYAGFPFYSPIYREICNVTNAASSTFTQGKYGRKQKFVAHLLYALFRLSSEKKMGDQFVGLFEKE